MKPWEQYAGSGTEQAGTDALDTSEATKPWEVAKQKALPASFSKTPDQLKAELAVSQSQEAPQSLMEWAKRAGNQVGPSLTKLAEGVGAIPGALAESVRQTVADPMGALKSVPGAVLDIADQAVRYPIERITQGAFGTPEDFTDVLVEGAVTAGAPEALGVGKQVIQGAAGAGARKLTNTVLKPNLKDQAFKKDPTGAILRNKITGNSIEDYGANIQAKIDEFHGMTDAQLAKSTKTVPVNEVTAIMDSEVKRIKDSVGISNKEALLSRIEELQSDILTRHAGENIPLRDLHALRKEIDSNITKFTMDAVEQGANASKFEARTGINKLIRNQEPKVEKWMKEESELLSAKEAIDRQANRTRNAGFGVGDTGAAIAGEVMAHGAGIPGAGAAAGVVAKHALGSTAVKSRVAKYLNTLAGDAGEGAIRQEAVQSGAAVAKAFKMSDEERNSIQQLAHEYVENKGRKLPSHKVAEVKEELSKKLADFYETSKHTPDDPKVQASYKALADETMEQWDAIHDAGYTFEKWTGEGEPYANSAAMIDDVRNKKHLYYKPSDTGFGTGEEGTKQLMMQQSKAGIPINDVFRAVHDFFGHSKEGNQFGPKGEFNAWLIHSDMYSPEAQGALAAETLAQNSVVNFGKAMRNAEGKIIKKGEAGYLGPTERPFAEQKNVVVPDELITEAKGKAPFKASSDEPLAVGNYMVDNKGKIHQLRNDETHRQWIERNYSKPESKMIEKYQDFDKALDEGYVRARVQNGNLIIEASQNNPNWLRDIKRLEARTVGDQPVYIDTFQNGNLKQFHFDDPQEFRDWINAGGKSRGPRFDKGSAPMTAAELDSMEAGLASKPRGERGITQRFIAEQRAKLKKEKPAVAIKGSTVEAVDAEVEAQNMVDAWVDEFKGGAPKKTKGTNYETGRRVYEGRNFGDIPGLNKVGAGDEAIVRALNTQEGPVWDKINQAARDEAEFSSGTESMNRRMRYSAEPTGKSGTFKEEDFTMPGDVDRTYKGPERRKLPRAEGTIREEEFNWPDGVTELKNPTPEKSTGFSPKRGKIVLNDDKMDELTTWLGASKLHGVQIHSGVGLDASEVRGRAFISDLKKKFPKEFAMVPTNKPLTIQRIGDSAYFKDTARHEGTHKAIQSALEGELHIHNTKNFTTEGEVLYKFALNKKKHYAPADRAEEIFADLATGNPMRLGLTRNEGLQLLGDMLEQLGSQYGQENMQTIMKRFSPRFYERAPEKMGNKLPTFKRKPSAEWDAFEKEMTEGMSERQGAIDKLKLPNHVEVMDRGPVGKEGGMPEGSRMYDINVKGGPQNITFYLPEGADLKSKVKEMADAWKIKLSDQAPGEPTWYGTAKQRLEEIGKQHGIELKTLAGVAAALSPNNRWAQNVVDVKKWAAAYKAGTLTETSSAGTFGKNRAKAFKILNGEDPEKVLQGPKVKAFYKALIGEGDEPVIDFHMANILRGSGYKTTKETEGISAAEYKRLAQQLIDEASAAGMKPADYQAKKWIEHRDRGQKNLFPERGGE